MHVLLCWALQPTIRRRISLAFALCYSAPALGALLALGSIFGPFPQSPAPPATADAPLPDCMQCTPPRARRCLFGKPGGLPGHHLPLSAVVDIHVSKSDAKIIGPPVRHDVHAGRSCQAPPQCPSPVP